MRCLSKGPTGENRYHCGAFKRDPWVFAASVKAVEVLRLKLLSRREIPERDPLERTDATALPSKGTQWVFTAGVKAVGRESKREGRGGEEGALTARQAHATNKRLPSPARTFPPPPANYLGPSLSCVEGQRPAPIPKRVKSSMDSFCHFTFLFSSIDANFRLKGEYQPVEPVEDDADQEPPALVSEDEISVPSSHCCHECPTYSGVPRVKSKL
ncbi:hypothetical protein B0H13DRAFT_2544009 [Mycena leptocephala]|nr:hypothetical protein B0H13DRAFT_2544009 [Mycena leptocephala]